MKLRWKVTIGLVVVGIAAAVTLSRRASIEQRALEQTRRELRAQGFKIDVAEFDFSTPEAICARIRAVTNSPDYNYNRSPSPEYEARRSFLQQGMPGLMQPIDSDVAIVVWKQRTFSPSAYAANFRFGDFPKEDLWPILRLQFADDKALLDAACLAVISGPIRFHLDANRGSAMLLPNLAPLKNFVIRLGERAVLDLHDGKMEDAWLNVIGMTRMVTAWETEPVEISYLVKTACAALVLNSTWQALQTDSWSDEQLGQLQREWESVDFFKALPETAAFSRAAAAQSCQQERSQPLEDYEYGSVAQQFFQSPKDAWANLRYRWQMVRHRRHGSFEDERNLLLYYRDRELELRKASLAQTWSEMRTLPGATNTVPFQSRNFSGALSMLNSKQLMLSTQMYSAGGPGRTVTARVAEAEARRRVIVTAIALERFHKRAGNYPKSLAELSPDFLKTPLVDFMDGQPLRYRTTDDGHFVIYSVGLDCVDNGGEIQRSARDEVTIGERSHGGGSRRRETDLVWPRPASDAEWEAFQREQIRARAEQKQREDEQQAEFQWSMTAEKQLRAEKILASNTSGTSTEPKYRARPLVDVLGNKSVIGTNAVRISELLTLKRVPTEAEPEALTFDVPIMHDVLTNLGQLALLVDRTRDGDFFDDSQGCWVELRRATNGSCLLTWNTIYESPGLHALQLALACSDPTSDGESPLVVGPVAAFTVSNLCQFSSSSAYFQPELGATLRAKLPEPNASYLLEITAPSGELLKTITGSTSNGLVTIHWDLVDDRGVRRTNSSFNTLVHVKLQDSGQSQTLRGP